MDACKIRAGTPGKLEHVDRPHDRGLHGGHRVKLVADGRGRARQMVDLIDLDVEPSVDVMADEFKTVVVEKRLDIALLTGDEVVDAQHLMPFAQKPTAEV